MTSNLRPRREGRHRSVVVLQVDVLIRAHGHRLTSTCESMDFPLGLPDSTHRSDRWRTVGGRWPVDNVTSWFDVSVSQIRAGRADAQSPTSISHGALPQWLDIVEITILHKVLTHQCHTSDSCPAQPPAGERIREPR